MHFQRRTLDEDSALYRTVLDFCNGLKSGAYIVNRDYQRSDAVWPSNAKSFLIETILLEYPVPKLSVHQNLDVKTRKTVKQIVDGQQRSAAILEFYQNKFRLAKTLETERFANRTFDELDEDDQAVFLDYGLNFDVFVGATVDEVREVFRRMNSFAVPLNPEETRHAVYQGSFKWFINSLTKKYDVAFSEVGVFTGKQLTRMVDSKLLTELTHALFYGITTTAAGGLNKLYKEKDSEFPEESTVRATLEAGLDRALFECGIAGTQLTKPHNFYSLTLACIQVAGGAEIPGAFTIPRPSVFLAGDPQYNLSLLAEVLEAENGVRHTGGLAEFAAAAKDRTNVASQRRTRFEYFVAALSA